MASQPSIDYVNNCIASLKRGKAPRIEDSAQFPEDDREIIDALNEILHNIVEASRFAYNIASGYLETTAPAKANYLAFPLKELQSNMKHLIWQLGRIANGNFSQSLDFMGDYSEVFTSMVKKISAREKLLSEKIEETDREKTELVVAHGMLSSIIENISEMVTVVRGGKVLFKNITASRIEAQVSTYEDNIVAHILADSFSGNDFSETEYYDANLKRWFATEKKKLMWSDGENAYLYVTSDVTERKRTEILLKRNLEYDELTTIANRKHIMRILKEAVVQKNGFPIALCFIDLDNLKYLNDEFGHAVGDSYLKNFATRFRSFLDRGKLIARLGGDEFLVMMRFTDRKAAIELLEVIRGDFRSNKDNVFPVACDFSYGVVQIDPGDLRTVDEIVEQADALMYKQKQAKYREKKKNISKNAGK